MVLINIEQVDGKVIMNCHKNTEDGEFFRMILDAETGKVKVIYKLKDGKNFGLVEPEA